MFKKKTSEPTNQVDREYNEPDIVEELHEEGSAMLSERSVPLNHYYSVDSDSFDLVIINCFICCLLDQLFIQELLTGCRLDTKYPLCNMFRLFTCAVCQVEMKPGEGVSIHAGSSKPGNSRPWDGPFLCPSCQEKKEAMEGKRGKESLSFSLSHP